jgi:ABC-type multidrug transport system fused ATPase/permease subunit
MKFLHVFKNNIFLIKKIFNYNKTLFIAKLIYACITSGITVVGVLLPKYLLDAVISGIQINVLYTLLVYGSIMLLHYFITYFYNLYCSYNDEKNYIKAIDEFLIKGIELDLIYFEKSESYDRYNRAFENCCNVIQNSNKIIVSLITSLLQLGLLTSILIWMNKYIFLVIVFFVLIRITISNYSKKIEYKFKYIISEKNRKVNYLYRLFYVPQFLRDLKSNNLSSFILRKKELLSNEIVKLTKRQSKDTGICLMLNNIIDSIEYIVIAFYFGVSVLAKKIMISDYFTCIYAYNQLKNSLSSILNSYSELYSNSLFADDYIEFMNCTENTATNINGYSIKESDIYQIQFKNVSFKYPNAQEYAIKQVSFIINKGEKVAIVGKNGAGKTTIIKLLLRLYDPCSGEILINNKNIKEYNTEMLRSSLQVLFQDYAVYAFTIRDNITYGKNIDDEHVMNALGKVGLLDKVNNFNLKLDTPITSQLYEGGVEFSGGETQRIALSRIYASKPKWFIMDEPTSNLDPYAEYNFYQNVMDEMGSDNTLMVISHRLTLTYKMSKIIVINQGECAEMGNHQELVSLNGIYSEMYCLQAEKFVEHHT